MKLIFTKDHNKEICVQLQNGTIAEDFSYVEMIKQLLANNNFDDTDFTNLADDEQKRLKSMLEKVTNIFKEDNSNEVETADK